MELTDESKDETGLTVDDVVKAEPLDNVLQQVSVPNRYPHSPSWCIKRHSKVNKLTDFWDEPRQARLDVGLYEGSNTSETTFLLGRMTRALAADSLGAEDLAEVALGASGDKQDLQVRSCLGLMLETEFVRRNVYLGPRLCFRLRRSRGRGGGVVADPGLC